MLKKLLALVLRPPLPQLTGLLLLTAIIWFGGRASRSWLGLTDGTLLGLCVGLWVLAAAVFVWRRFQAAQRARQIEDRLRGQAREHRESARPDRRSHVEALEKQLNEALNALKGSKMGKSALYALPWYIIIGPPGSGKTTLLRESGLSFPQLTHGRGLRGVGGTRNCDWWFTDAGILLDTAGRYTTQVEDRDEWLSFLEMLKRARSRKPINGALIAISLADIIQSNEEQLAEHARRVRERLAELTERLELVFPVYLLFTKCDLLEGFVDTFGSYSKKERSQVWGFTLPYLQKDAEPVPAIFAREFAALHQRLSAERLQVLGTAKSQAKKRKIFSFPLQFELARDRLAEFVGMLAQPNPFHESSDLRGCYFTSGTQEGKPLDQILRTMREAAGLQGEPEEVDEESTEKKAYFIDDLFTKVVFPDQDLSRSSAKAEQRRGLLRRAGLVATAIAAFLLTIWMFVSFAGHANLVERCERVCRAAAAFDPSREEHLAVEEGTTALATKPFEDLRQLFVELDRSYGTLGSYILGQTNSLYERRVRPLYVQKTRIAFVEPLQRRLQQQLTAIAADKGRDRDVQEIADLLTAYRMLGGELLLNREWLGENFLKRKGSWTWRSDREVEACRPHRQAFLDHVVGPLFRDWVYLPEEALIPVVNELVRGKDIYGRELQSVLEEQGQAGTVSWQKILSSNPQSQLLDESAGVVAAYVNETPLDDVLDRKGELLGGASGEALKTRRRQDAIDSWKKQLAAMGPKRKSNIEDSMKDVAALTGENSVYLAAYKEVSSRLQGLGVESRVGDVAWLQETLLSIQALQVVIRPLHEARGHLDRIVPAARRGDDGVLGDIRRAFKKVRITIRSKTEEYADAQLRDSMQRALMGLLDTLQFALAREIEEETNKVWAASLGKELLEFSQRFPFRADAEAVVETDRFDAVCRRGGEFDRAREWIRYLEETVNEIGFSAVDAAFVRDRELIDRIQKALYPTAGGEQGCDVEFLLQKVGNMTAVRFSLGDRKIEAKATENPTLRWQPHLGASIEVREFQAFQDKLDSKIEFGGKWGLLRLLAGASPAVASARGKEYHVFRWDAFKHPRTGQLLAVGETKAEAVLRLRTEDPPNPLAPGFWTHNFSREVFRAQR